jgi:hypothetical protein
MPRGSDFQAALSVSHFYVAFGMTFDKQESET